MNLFFITTTLLGIISCLSNSAEARYYYEHKGWLATKLTTDDNKSRVHSRKIPYSIVYEDDLSFCEIRVKGQPALKCDAKIIQPLVSLPYEYGHFFSYFQFKLSNSEGAELLRRLNSNRKSRRKDLSNLINRFEKNGRTEIAIHSRVGIYDNRQKYAIIWRNQKIPISDHESGELLHLFSKVKWPRKITRP